MELKSRRRGSRTIAITVFFLHCLFQVYECFTINSTGGSFPVNVYAEATFAYQFTSTDLVSYFGGGSGKKELLNTEWLSYLVMSFPYHFCNLSMSLMTSLSN